MKLRKRKGFTLVELLVVIAILAVLATVSILGYSAFVKKANISNDKAIVEQMNKALLAYETIDEKARYCDEAVDQAVEAGFILENLTPSTSGYHYAYDQQYNRFMLLTESHSFEYGDNNHTNDKYRIHVVVGSAAELKAANEEGYSTYIRKEFEFEENSKNTITTSKGIDVGKNVNVSTIIYNNSEGTQDVVIRTNSASINLKINAKNDKIEHYGRVGLVEIEKVATTSYVEKGEAAYIDIAYGRIVLEDGAEVNTINIKATSNAYEEVILAMAGGDLPKNITRDKVNVTDKTILVKVQKLDSSNNITDTETIYVYQSGETGYVEKTSSNENKNVVSELGQMIIETIAGQHAINSEVKQQQKTEAIADLIDGELWIEFAAEKYNSGTGTKEDPYIISTSEQLAKIAYDVNNGLSNNKYYKLTENVDLTGRKMTPIGNDNHPFVGYFDGNGKTISGLALVSVDDNCALFGVINGAEIKNITFNNVAINTTTFRAAAVVGYVKGSNNTISNIIVNGKIANGGKNAGAVVADVYEKANLSITNVVNNAEILSNKASGDAVAAGIIAQANGTVVLDNCVNKGNISAIKNGSGYVAGLVSFVQNGDLTIKSNCSNTGTLDGNYVGNQVCIVLNIAELNVASSDCIGYVSRQSNMFTYQFVVDGKHYIGRFGGKENNQYKITSFADAFNNQDNTLNKTSINNYIKLVEFAHSKGEWETEKATVYEAFIKAWDGNKTSAAPLKNTIFGSGWDNMLSEYNSVKSTDIKSNDFGVNWTSYKLYCID